jgi:hypothetical protein
MATKVGRVGGPPARRIAGGQDPVNVRGHRTSVTLVMQTT